MLVPRDEGLFLGWWGFLAIPLTNLRFLYCIQPFCVTDLKLLLNFIYHSLALRLGSSPQLTHD